MCPRAIGRRGNSIGGANHEREAAGPEGLGEATGIGGNVLSVDIQRLGAFHKPRHGLARVAALQVVEELRTCGRAHGDAQAENSVGREDDGIAGGQGTDGLFL